MRGRPMVLNKFYTRVAGCSSAILVTSESCGTLRAVQIDKPFLDSEDMLWFRCTAKSFIVDNIESCPDVLVIWPSPHLTGKPASIAGSGFVVTNLKIKQNIWARAQWPTAPLRPLSGDVVLIRVAAYRVEYWDEESQRQTAIGVPVHTPGAMLKNRAGTERVNDFETPGSKSLTDRA